MSSSSVTTEPKRQVRKTHWVSRDVVLICCATVCDPDHFFAPGSQKRSHLLLASITTESSLLAEVAAENEAAKEEDPVQMATISAQKPVPRASISLQELDVPGFDEVAKDIIHEIRHSGSLNYAACVDSQGVLDLLALCGFLDGGVQAFLDFVAAVKARRVTRAIVEAAFPFAAQEDAVYDENVLYLRVHNVSNDTLRIWPQEARNRAAKSHFIERRVS
jgi:hypothetical protein